MSKKTIVQLHHELKNQIITCTELIENTYQKIEETEPKLKAFLSLCKDEALSKASSLDERFKKGDSLPFLAGIPIAIKDNLAMKGQPLTCASKMLEHFISPYNATVIEKLNQHLMIPVGKTNLDEFAMGSSTENSAYGPSRNPYDTNRTPGGSSGGSAATVGGLQVPVSLGSDTGGSIRQPASFCNIVGLKPTYGRVSRYGLVAFASSLDQIGPFTHTVEDMAHILTAICGHDVHDATSAQVMVPDFSKALKKDIKGLKIAVPKQLMTEAFDPAIRDSVSAALDVLVAQGAHFEEVDMPSLTTSIPTYYIIAPAEASSNLARYDGVRYTIREEGKNLKDMMIKTRSKGFGKEVKRRIMLGTFALSSGYYDAYYIKAQKARAFIQQEFNHIFKTFDIVMTPTTPDLPFKFGEKSEDPMAMYLADLATIPANMAGLPAISVPGGFSKGLPIGIQMIGKAFDEETLLNVADCYQSLTAWHLESPEGHV